MMLLTMFKLVNTTEGNKMGMLFPYFVAMIAFAEEIGPGTDILPTASLALLYVYGGRLEIACCAFCGCCCLGMVLLVVVVSLLLTMSSSGAKVPQTVHHHYHKEA